GHSVTGSTRPIRSARSAAFTTAQETAPPPAGRGPAPCGSSRRSSIPTPIWSAPSSAVTATGNHPSRWCDSRCWPGGLPARGTIPDQGNRSIRAGIRLRRYGFLVVVEEAVAIAYSLLSRPSRPFGARHFETATPAFLIHTCPCRALGEAG